MTDIVRTIQAEQDRIIRADARGVLVVQGGPGTGKTAVALHRAAYLLYTHRERLARSGLLIVGPSPTFLRYIADVLPSLGETGVVLADLGGLRPGLEAHAAERPEVAEVKGRLAMADVIAAAVRSRQAVLDAPGGARRSTARRCGSPRPTPPGSASAGPVGLPAAQRGPARRRPRASSSWLAHKYADTLGANVLGGANLLDAGRTSPRCAGRSPPSPRCTRLIDRLWPRLTAERLVRDLFASRERLAAATPGWSDADREPAAPAGRRPRGRRPTCRCWRRPTSCSASTTPPQRTRGPARPAAAPAARPGDPRPAARVPVARTARRRRRPRSSAPATCSTPRAWPSARRTSTPGRRPSAPAADRTWTYGHVIVDEAQELSAMAWRLLLRRCPTRSMTVVGDVAQTGSPAGAASWAEVLDPHLGPHWRLEELTVNYRTPAEIMDVAADGARRRRIDRVGRRVRALDRRPAVGACGSPRPTCPARASPRPLPSSTRRTARSRSSRRMRRLDAVADAVRARVPAMSADLTAGPVVLPPEGAKGLEFDSVLVVDPAGIVAEGVRGHNDLYVALTRATQRLGVVHAGELLPELAGLDVRGRR